MAAPWGAARVGLLVLGAVAAVAGGPTSHDPTFHNNNTTTKPACDDVCVGLSCDTPRTCAVAAEDHGCACFACLGCEAERRLVRAGGSWRDAPNASWAGEEPPTTSFADWVAAQRADVLATFAGLDLDAPVGAVGVSEAWSETCRADCVWPGASCPDVVGLAGYSCRDDDGDKTHTVSKFAGLNEMLVCDCSGCAACPSAADEDALAAAAAARSCGARADFGDVFDEAGLRAAFEGVGEGDCGAVTLRADVTLAGGSLAVRTLATVVLRMRGAGAVRGGGRSRLIAVGPGARLEVDGGELSDGAATFPDLALGGCVIGANAAEIVVSNSTIARCYASFMGSAIFVNRGSNVTLRDATVVDCASAGGGAIAVGALPEWSGNWAAAESRVEILGASALRRCFGLTLTGGVLTLSRSTILVDGAAVFEDLWGGRAGAIEANMAGVVRLRGATFRRCQGHTGGAVQVYRSALYAVDTTFEDCAAEETGGAVYVAAGVAWLGPGAAIRNCRAELHGGGVYAYEDSLVYVAPGAEIRGCSAGLRGGGLGAGLNRLEEFAARDGAGGGGRARARERPASYVVVAGLVAGCVAGAGGGGLAVIGELSLQHARVEGCAADGGDGGGVWLGDLTRAEVMLGSKVSDCYASGRGGGIYGMGRGASTRAYARTGKFGPLESSDGFDAIGSEIVGNVAGVHGGGLYVEHGLAVTLFATLIANNQALDGDGGGFYCFAQTPVKVGGNARIEGNAAPRGFGGGFLVDAAAVCASGSFSPIGAVVVGNVARSGGGGAVRGVDGAIFGSRESYAFVTVGLDFREEIWAGDDVWATVYNATRALEPLVDVRGVRAYVAAKTNRLARMSILIDAHISVDYLYGFFGGHGLGWGAGKPYVQLETRRGAPRIKDLEDVDVLRPGTHAEEISLSLAWTDLVDDYEQELGFAQALRHWDCARVANATAGLDCEGVAGALAALAALVDVDGALRWIVSDLFAQMGDEMDQKYESGSKDFGTEENPDAFYDGMAHAPGRTRADGRGAPDTSWIFERNEATDGDGGALHIGRGGRAYLDTVACRGNAAGARGGCVHVEALATLELTRAGVAGNAAGDEGGGVSATTLATVFAADVRVADNTARRGGGAAFTTCEAVRLERATLARNAAVEEGGGLFVAETPRIDLDECRVEANEATGPGASDGGLATARAACRGCACFADPYGGFSRYVAVSRDGAEVERLTPRAGAVVAYDRCLPPGRYAFRAVDDFGDGWFGGTYAVTIRDDAGRRARARGPSTASRRSTSTSPSAAAGARPSSATLRRAAAAARSTSARPRPPTTSPPRCARGYAGNEAAYGPEVATPAVALVAATADELEALRAAAGAPGAADAAAGRVPRRRARGRPRRRSSRASTRSPESGAPRRASGRGGNATDRGDDDGWRLSERVHLAAGGVAAFEGLAVQGPGGGRARLVFSAPALGSDITESSSFQLAVSRDCPEGYRESSRRGTLYCEPCTAGEYWAGGGCLDCPRGARCAVGATVGTLEITRGYWRSGERSDRVEACFRRRSCVGGGACAEGYLGPLCNACGDGFHAVPWRTTVGALDCARCPGPLPTAAAACLVGFLVVAAALAGRAYVATGLESARRRVRGLVAPRFAGDWAAPTSWLKIVWATYQIVSQSDWATNTAYPPPFAYSNAVLSVVELDVAAMTSFACTLDFDALDRMVLAAVAPSFGLALLFLAGRVLPLGGDQRRRLASLVLLVTFATLPTVSTPAFRTFPCRDFDGGIRVLEADYGVSCRGRRYGLFRLFAAIVVALWPVGVPLSIFVYLRRRRRALDPTAYAADALEADALSRARSNDADLAASAFLWASYRPPTYYWECVDMGRRVLLTGGVVFAGSDATRCFAGLAIALAFLLLMEMAAPYADPGSNALGVAGAWQVACSFLILFLCSTRFLDVPRVLLGFVALVANLAVLAGLSLSRYLEEQRKRRVEADAFEASFRECELDYDRMMQNDIIDRLLAERRGGAPAPESRVVAARAPSPRRPRAAVRGARGRLGIVELADDPSPRSAGSFEASPSSTARLPTAPSSCGEPTPPGSSRRRSRRRRAGLRAALRAKTLRVCASPVAAGAGRLYERVEPRLFGSAELRISPLVAHYPCYVVSLSRLRTLGRLVSHGRAKRLGLLEELTATSRSPHSAASFFVSHEWEGADHPDNHANTKLRWLQSLDRHVGVGHAEVWIWLDYLCVPQEPGAKRRRALASLCCYANLCSRFVPLVRSPAAWSRLYGHGAEPPGALPGTLHSYLARAWSRLELCAALSPKYGRGGAGWRPGPRNVRFRCHEDPASPGVGPRVTTKHLLPPLAGVFDRGDDRVLAARLVAALGRIFEECRLQFEAAERRGRARSPRNPLRAVDLGGPDAGAVPRWLLGAATGRAAMPTFVDYGAGAGADAADADEAGIEVDVGEFAGDAQASETLLQGYLGLPRGRVAFASRGARSAAAVRRGAALDDLEFRSAGDLGHARREIRRVVEAARAPRPFTLWLRRPGGGEFASVVVHALRFGGAGGAARVALVGNVLSDAQLREAVALSDAARAAPAPVACRRRRAVAAAVAARVLRRRREPPDAPGLLRRVAADAARRRRPARAAVADAPRGAAPAAAPRDREHRRRHGPPRDRARGPAARRGTRATSPGLPWVIARGAADVFLLRYVAASGALEGSVYRPLPGVEHIPRLEAPYVTQMASGGARLPTTTHVFARAPGETERAAAVVRAATPLAAGSIFGCGECWHHLVGLPPPDALGEGQAGAAALDAMSRARRVAGGQLDVGADGTLSRWCVYTSSLRPEPSDVLALASQVPLPFERLWLICVKEPAGDDGARPRWPGWAPGPRDRDELEAAGRLQYTSATSFIVKAATVDARAYEDARSAVLVAMNARQRFREAKAELRASAAGARARDDARRLAAEARLHEAHLEYSASKASLRGTAALETFLRGKRERRALRGLGIFDDRWPRLYARLRLVEIGRADTGSVLSLLPRDIALYLLEFLLMRPGDLGVARARAPRPRGSPRDALVHPA
ncbi:hypothetical protein JL722_8041 [Aureococcus anophagefferens]|nr:hypothetical protein JL722_8041 [Aureococcus anophagefferens]